MLDQNEVTTQSAEMDQGEIQPKISRNEPAPRKDQLAEIYGSFHIDESEFAIPVSAVKEVVNAPESISPIPLAPSYMLGLFNLRGLIIPVVDLRILLNFGEQVESGPIRKVAIIEHGENCIGLLFDGTGEVLSGANAARVDFQSKEDGSKDIVIEGVLKFDNGNRLVQVLNPHELLNLEKVPRTNKDSDQSVEKASKGKRQNCISFQTGHTHCALDLRHVKEILVMPAIDQSLFARGNVIGTCNLRGNILPVLDFRKFLGDSAIFRYSQTAPKERKMLVLETTEGPIGLMVYSIDSIESYFKEDILTFAKLALPRSDFVSGCLVNDESRIVMMLDHNKLCSDPELLSIAKACQEVYPSETSMTKGPVAKGGSARRTFIQFSFGKPFALDTAFVSEVINRPEHLLEPPYALDFVEGIINLRGELITLLNPRLLYGLPPGEATEQKVLIFRHEGTKFGILVDSVDEIIMTNVGNVAELQHLDRQSNGKQVIEDVAGCLHHKRDDGVSTSVLVLDSASLIKRCINSLVEPDITHLKEEVSTLL